MRLLVTRPEPDAARTAEALRALGHEPLISPVLDLVFETAKPLLQKEFQAVLVTSSNAVRALAKHAERDRLLPLPVLAVGDRTALEARRAGFKNARSAGGALGDLSALVRSTLRPDAGPVLYAAGEVQAGDLGQSLTAEGFSVETAILYGAEPRLRLSDGAVNALRSGAVDGVLLYSERSAAAFALATCAAGLAPLAETVAFFCLSPAMAAPLRAIGGGPVLYPERPDQISLFAIIERFGARRRAASAKG